MKSADIREAFLNYFENKQHQIVPSSSLVPANDPTLLFTNAGMVQFKDLFLGKEKRNYVRATSSQRCVRAGGKHNDLENVGYTARHHTFFEMLGNFSFGDYFKQDAIRFAWEFLTDVLKIPAEKLWVTVHHSDDEAADIWINDIGVDPNRLSRLDEDNFWQMGDTGPCGPCSEIFYDHGEDVPGGPPGSENDDLDRYIEIWNLVFMQYERQSNGELIALPKPSVDTGMGLERMAAVMQGVHNNYDIDLFKALVDGAAKATGCDDLTNKSLRVIADHIRSCAFLVSDGVVPSNEGRGYVLRRIIRRAIRHGHNLGQSQPFFSTLVPVLVEQMGSAYPELLANQQMITSALLAEEQQFAKTLDKGMAVFESRLAELPGTEIPGETIFILYDTYGFPVDLTNDIARERSLSLDMAGYEERMEEQKARARASGSFKLDYSAGLKIEGAIRFTGYEHLQEQVNIVSLFVDGEEVESAKKDEQVVVVLDSSPFYAESGGQVGDCGLIETASARLEITDCQKSGEQQLHIGKVLQGQVNKGDTAQATVDIGLRQATALNHSATHLLHAALRQLLGEHVTQKGSLVDSERLRFDFSHPEPLTPEQLQRIEEAVNEQVRHNTPVLTHECSMEEAKNKGAMMLFGEKYGEQVRVLSMGEGFSVELCGGTHVKRTGDIGLFVISSESGVAAGIRRIEAVTGQRALALTSAWRASLSTAAFKLKVKSANVLERLDQLVDQNKRLEKELSSLKAQLASSSADDWLTEAEEINGVKVLVKTLEGVDAKSLRDTIDQLKNKLGSSAILLATISSGKVAVAAGVSKDATAKIKAGDMVRLVAEQIGGKGGGRPDMAQGGGSDVDALPAAMATVVPWAKKHLV